MAETPQNIESHQQDYSNKAWELYTLSELGDWVHLLTKRAEHRTNFAKKDKDLQDASNYLAMMQSKLNESKQVNIEDFAKAIAARMADDLPGVHLVKTVPTDLGHVQQQPHDLATVSWIVPDGSPYTGFANTWNLFIEPAIQALVGNIGGLGVIYELETPSADMGTRSLVETFENMSVRFVTSYHVGKGLRTTIDVGIPKEDS